MNKISLEIFLEQVALSAGKPNGWPACFKYAYKDEEVRIELPGGIQKKI